MANSKAPAPDAQPPLTDDQRLAEWDWLITPDGNRLHHARLNADLADYLTDGGVENIILTCGRWVGWASIPGLFARMGAYRCQRCCDRIGYPRGKGSPKNDDACRPLVEARIGGVA